MAVNVRDLIAEAYHSHQYGDNGTHHTMQEADDIATAILLALGTADVVLVEGPEYERLRDAYVLQEVRGGRTTEVAP